MNKLQKILSKEKNNSCNPNRESMILDYVLTMLGRGDSLETINEVAGFLRKFDNKGIVSFGIDYGKDFLDTLKEEIRTGSECLNPINEVLLEKYNFAYEASDNTYFIWVFEYRLSIKIYNDRDIIMPTFFNSKSNVELAMELSNLQTEKQLINLIQTLFGVTLTKKQ